MGTYLFLFLLFAVAYLLLKINKNKKGLRKQNTVSNIPTSDQKQSSANDDLIRKWRFVPNFSPDTPLFALLKAGDEIQHFEDAKELPHSNYGHWWPQSITFRELGVDIDEFPDVFEDELQVFLPPLIQFRKYIEGIGPLENRIAHAVAYCSTPQGKKLVTKFQEEYDPFPEAFFWGPLNRLRGLGPSKIALLKQHGIITQRDLTNADDEKILSLPGIGEKTLATMRSYLKETPWSVPGTGEVEN